MGLRDFAFGRRKAVSASPEILEALRDRRTNFNNLIAVGPNPYGPNRAVQAAFVQAQSAQLAYIYAHQPSVRRVVDYIARNVSQLGLKLYERIGDTERTERADHPAAETFRTPNEQTPGQQFVFNVVADYLVFDNTYILKMRTQGGPLVLLPLPSPSVAVIGNSRYRVDGYRIYRSDGSWFDVPPEDVVHWHGYNPEDPRIGISKLETLRYELASDRGTQTAGDELMKAGLGTAGIIERPLDAPEWTEKARTRFEEDWANRAKQATKKTPVLEEGMAFKPAFVSPKDAQMLDSRIFTRDEVASLYGVGSIPPASEDERRQFYSDVLPPICELFCDHLDLSVLAGEFGESKLYFEFDLDEKLTGDERLKALTSASGAPILTRNESRAMLNKPPKEGGDELIVPLNVIVGGKPSPSVMPIQDPVGPEQDGSQRNGNSANGRIKSAQFLPRRVAQIRRRDGYADQYAEMLRKFFSDQERSLKTSKEKAFDTERWNTKLFELLYKLMKRLVEAEGAIVAAYLGLSAFDGQRTESYLRLRARDTAKAINLTTDEALRDGEIADVFNEARDVRAAGGSLTLGTFTSNFSQYEAAKQDPNSDRLKRWVVFDTETSAHPEMDGETVPLEHDFSNGKSYPPYEHPRCLCLVEIL